MSSQTPSTQQATVRTFGAQSMPASEHEEPNPWLRPPRSRQSRLGTSIHSPSKQHAAVRGSRTHEMSASSQDVPEPCGRPPASRQSPRERFSHTPSLKKQHACVASCPRASSPLSTTQQSATIAALNVRPKNRLCSIAVVVLFELPRFAGRAAPEAEMDPGQSRKEIAKRRWGVCRP